MYITRERSERIAAFGFAAPLPAAGDNSQGCIKSLPQRRLGYRAKGINYWKHQALATRRYKERVKDIHLYSPSFLGSDWKLFHDALQDHRFYVIHNLLPLYGICAA